MKKKHFKNSIIFILFILITACKSNPSVKVKNQSWTGTWACAQMQVEPQNMPPEPGLSGNTLRQIIKVSIGGEKLRFRFSNLFTNEPMIIKSVSISCVAQAPAIAIKTQQMLHFNQNTAVTIAPETAIYSDIFDFPLRAGQLLAITIHYEKVPKLISGHPGSRTTSYLLEGDHQNNEMFSGAVKTDHWYTIMGLDVLTTKNTANIVCLGNSITDGRGSGTNKQNRWTDILASRLAANKQTEHIGVLNLGIGGNCVVKGGLGPMALERFDRDVLSQSGTKWLVILEGINDIGNIKHAEEAPAKAQEIIEAYKTMIDKAHARGIKVYGCTILPFQKSFYDAPFKQEARAIVNAWIRNGSFDAVIDFDKEMESEAGSKTILPNMHDNDFLHPNELGYKRMGEAVDLNLFR